MQQNVTADASKAQQSDSMFTQCITQDFSESENSLLLESASHNLDTDMGSIIDIRII